MTGSAARGDATGSALGRLPVRVVEASKTYAAEGEEPVHALIGVSLDIRAGEMVALMGPSGCGKSTLLNLIGCVDLPTSGVVEVDGRDTAQLNDDALTELRRDRVGSIFQFFNLLPALDVSENVGLPLVLQRRPRLEVAERVRAALESVGLEDKARALPAQLSGGQAQRVAVARAVVHRPAIVLADEPTGNLDSRSGAGVLELLRVLASGGQAILIATHAAEAAAACDRIVRMQDGRIV